MHSLYEEKMQNPLLDLPWAASSYFSESHQWSELSSLSKMILVLEKARSHRAPNLGYREAESPGWFDVLPEKLCTRCDAWAACCGDEADNYLLPVAVASCMIWVVSMEGCSRLTQNLMQIHCSIHSVILNVTATQYTCSLNDVYQPHWLVQWSYHCSHMRIPVHFPCLPGYNHVT